MKAAGRRRGFKSWFVEPYRQVRLGLMFVIINLIFSALIMGVFGYYLWDVYVAISHYFNLTNSEDSQTMTKLIVPALVGAGLILIFVITTILVSVKYTHQIYGPLVSIHRFLDQMISGQNPDRLNLRPSDQLKELAAKLNQMSERTQDPRRQSAFIPIHRFLDELLAGKQPEPLQLRDQDHFEDLVAKLNQLAERLQSRP